ncbi:MAG: 5'/3'-nucleotidase SurE [Thermoproteales archaeon]|nr:5'/3'-nucleotidase SurE [Thermoproteales archaeon]
MDILITNDDGPYSPGLKVLYESVKDIGNIYIVVPETPKSASGLGITLHKPLRVSRINFRDMDIFLINGTPSDIVYIALNTLFDKIDLVLSGVNIGDNTSMQVILSSGTIGAAAQAALSGIPAVAFSVAIDIPEKMEEEDMRKSLKKNIKKIVSGIVSKGFPKGIDIININFPNKPTNIFELAKIARTRYSNIVYERKDPRGQKYYWIYGEPLKPEPGTDVYVVHVKKNIAFTPIKLDFKDISRDSVIDFLSYLNKQ